MDSGREESPDGLTYYRLEEIEEHKTVKSTWIIINFNVYDVTKFLEEVRMATFHHPVTVRHSAARGKPAFP